MLLPNNQALPRLPRLAREKQSVINAPAMVVEKMDISPTIPPSYLNN